MSTTLPPWDQLTFSFGWDKEGASSIQQCSNVTFQYYDNPGGNVVPNPPPSPPYSLLIYGGGYEPLKVPINNTAMEGSFKWNANLPVGPAYALSIKDAKDYTGGILMPLLKTTVGTCNVSTPMKPSSLDVTVSGNSQCGQSIISVNNGTAPYKVEVVPGDDRQQKTMYFATSPFSVVLDMSEGVNYLLAVYDSAGHSSVEGLYTVGSSSDNSCLGSATTVTAGKFSTLYPGGTAAVSSATSTPGTTTSKPKLASPAIIGMGVGIPVVVLIIAGLLLWMCYKRNRRQREVDSSGKVEIDQFDPPAPIHSYTPVSTAFPYGGSTNHSGSHYDISNGSMAQHPPAPVPYPHPMDTSDRHTLNTVEGSSTSGYDRTSAAVSEKRRQLFTPHLQSLDAEPFDPYNGAGGSSADPSMPPLPPAYSPASRPS